MIVKVKGAAVVVIVMAIEIRIVDAAVDVIVMVIANRIVDAVVDCDHEGVFLFVVVELASS